MRLSPFLLIIFFLASPFASYAQDLDREIPDSPVPDLEFSEPAEGAEIDPEVGYAGAFEGEDMLLDRLIGVRFITSPEQVEVPRSGARIEIPGELSMLDIPEFRDSLRAFLDQPVSRQSLQRLEEVTRLFLAGSQYPFSLVFTPPQDITDGQIALVVQKSVLSEVKIQNNEVFSDAIYRNWIHQEMSNPIQAVKLSQDIAWINRHPYRQVRPVFRPGSEPATTRLILQANEARNWNGFLGYNNAGTATTELDRISGGINWGNVLGEDIAGVSFSIDPQAENFRAISVNYTRYLPVRHILTLSVVYSETDGIVNPPFSLEGLSYQVVGEYEIPMHPGLGGRLSQSAYLGLDFKASDNNFAFAENPITDNLTHVLQARIGWRGQWQMDEQSALSFDLHITQAPGGLTSKNEDEYFTVSRPDAESKYSTLGVDLSYARTLSPELHYNARFWGQLSSDRLIGSEQFGAGGATGPRGYEEGEAYTDNGVGLTQEFSFRRLSWGGDRGPQGSAQGYVFFDAAHGWNVDPNAGEMDPDLASVGVGFRFTFWDNLSGNAAYGWQLEETGLGEPGDEERFHLSLQARF